MRMAGLVSIGMLLTAASGAWQGPPTPPPKPLVPTATNSIVANPDGYYGQIVTVFAAVDRLLSPTSFTIDQDPKGSGKDEVVVLVASLAEPLSTSQYVTIIGEVIRQDNRPAIRATSVITAAGVDLAKVAPPPMTADEEALDRAMKIIGPAFTALRQAATNGSADNTSEQAAGLVRAMEEAEAFWKKRGPVETHRIAIDARAQASALVAAVKAGKWDDARAAAGTLQQACSSCHATHRERLEDGTYRIRTGSGRGN